MAFPQVAAVNGGYEGDYQYSHTVNLPANIDAGNLLLVFFAASGNPIITFPEGWTELFETYWYGVKSGAWYRVADGEEGATIIVGTHFSTFSSHTSYRITDYGGTPEVGTVATGDDAEPNPPSLTPTWGAKDTLWIACEGNDDGEDVVTAYPTNYTDGRCDRYSEYLGVCIGTARRELNAESEDPGVFTIAGIEGWVANTVAIKPLVPIELAGVSNGVASISGAIVRKRPISGSSAGVASVSGFTRVKRALAGLSAGVASVSGLLGILRPLSGISSGIASVSGSLSIAVTKWLSGISSGKASVSGSLQRKKGLSGISAGIASVTGSLTIGLGVWLSGASAGVASVTGSLGRIRPLAGISAGVASVSGLLGILKLLSGLSAGVATVSGSLSRIRNAVRNLLSVRTKSVIRTLLPLR